MDTVSLKLMMNPTRHANFWSRQSYRCALPPALIPGLLIAIGMPHPQCSSFAPLKLQTCPALNTLPQLC